MVGTTYKWRATTRFASNTPLSYGVTPPNQSDWQTAQIGTGGSGTWEYWFRDANMPNPLGPFSDDNSSRVTIRLAQTWSTSIDDLNNITVSVTATIGPIVRDDVRGTVLQTPGREMRIYEQEGGSPILSFEDYQIGTAHTIYEGPTVLANYTITLAPGQSQEKSTLYLHNQTIGEASYDDIWFGVQFLNDLPAPTAYRVTYDANGGTGAPAEQSHTTAQPSWSFTVASGTPTWGQYEFLGWSRTRYTDSRTEADVEFRAGDTITLQEGTPTVVLYAVWRKDYKPGATLSGVWLGHERTGGKCHIYNGSTFEQMRTIGGDANLMGTPPSVYHDGKWYNQHRRGKE